MPFSGRRLVAAAVLAGGATLAGVSVASADDPPPSSPQPPFAVEDFGYPGADRVLAEKGIKLLRGDGHIVLADCDQAAPQIRVYTVADASSGRQGTYCFKGTAKTGLLTLELPRVFAVEAADHPVSADLTANGQTTTVDVPKDGFEPVGEGTVGGARSVLVELRVTG